MRPDEKPPQPSSPAIQHCTACLARMPIQHHVTRSMMMQHHATPALSNMPCMHTYRNVLVCWKMLSSSNPLKHLYVTIPTLMESARIKLRGTHAHVILKELFSTNTLECSEQAKASIRSHTHTTLFLTRSNTHDTFPHTQQLQTQESHPHGNNCKLKESHPHNTFPHMQQLQTHTKH
eukprot:1161966-Pelagomonas_calceolata.AAC.5